MGGYHYYYDSTAVAVHFSKRPRVWIYVFTNRVFLYLCFLRPHRSHSSTIYQVAAEEVGHDIRPQRYPAPKNALSKREWPMEVLPRFASGPLYILSRYCVEFIVANKSWLRGVGTLEDVSVGLWLLALQVSVYRQDGRNRVAL